MYFVSKTFIFIYVVLFDAANAQITFNMAQKEQSEAKLLSSDEESSSVFPISLSNQEEFRAEPEQAEDKQIHFSTPDFLTNQAKQVTADDSISTDSVSNSFKSFKEISEAICQGQESPNVHCVRFCREIEDLKLESSKNRRIQSVTRALIENTIRSRICSNEGENSKYFCSVPDSDSLFPDNTFLFVTGGWSNTQQINSTELFDLSDSLASCRPLQNLPHKIQSSVATYTENGEILVCGGNSEGYDERTLTECYILNPSESESRWTNANPLKAPRSYAASTYVPNVNSFFVTGGTSLKIDKNNEVKLSTTELLDENGVWSYGPDLPEPISHHCVVHLQDERTVLIGGTNGAVSNSVWVLDWKMTPLEWTKGPSLEMSRVDHSCGIASLNNKSFAIIVVGGRNEQRTLSSSEVLVVNLNEELTEERPTWSQGPELPYQMTGSQMVQVPLRTGGKGLLLVGGYRQNPLSGWGIGFSQNIYFLNGMESTLKWKLLGTKLEEGRFETVALVIDKANFDCN